MKKLTRNAENLLRALYKNKLFQEMGKPPITINNNTVFMSGIDIEDAWEEISLEYYEGEPFIEAGQVSREGALENNKIALLIKKAIIGFGGIRYVNERYRIDNNLSQKDKLYFLMKLDNPLELAKFE